MQLDTLKNSVGIFSFLEGGAVTCPHWPFGPLATMQAGSWDRISVVLGSTGQSVPLTVLTDLRSREYSLNQLISLQIQSYQGHYLVSDTITYRHGLGVTLDDAIQDYEDDLISYFESLTENRANLSPALQRDLAQLAQFIKPR